MPDRKTHSRKRQQSGDLAGAATHAHGLSGNSETVFSDAELERIVDAVWEHGRAVPDADAALWRQDACGAWMMREHFGRTDSEFGWKMEKVAGDGAGLLRPYNWHNHFDIAESRPHCGVSAERMDGPAEPPRNKPR